MEGEGEMEGKRRGRGMRGRKVREGEGPAPPRPKYLSLEPPLRPWNGLAKPTAPPVFTRLRRYLADRPTDALVRLTLVTDRTACAGNVLQSVVSVRPSVCFHSSF